MPPLASFPPPPLTTGSRVSEDLIVANPHPASESKAQSSKLVDVSTTKLSKMKQRSQDNVMNPQSPPSPRAIFKRADSLSRCSPALPQKPLLLLRRSSSSGLTLRRDSSASSQRSVPRLSSQKCLAAWYQGPIPVRKDGSALKSCCRGTLYSQDCSVTSLESDDVTPPRRHHRVTFTKVCIREYSLECGDNPSVTSGPPITLGWKFNKREAIDIDTFEADKLGRGECRRLSAEERENKLLTIGGHSHRSIMNAQYETHLANQERRETINNLGGLGKARYIRPRERVEILKESAARKIERAYKGTSTAKEQRKLWEDAQVSGQKKA